MLVSDHTLLSLHAIDYCTLRSGTTYPLRWLAHVYGLGGAAAARIVKPGGRIDSHVLEFGVSVIF